MGLQGSQGGGHLSTGGRAFQGQLGRMPEPREGEGLVGGTAWRPRH